MAIRIYLRKNDLTENPKRPYFTLSVPPEEENGEWTNIGALWKAKSGNGYTGMLDEGIELDFTAVKPKTKKAATPTPEFTD